MQLDKLDKYKTKFKPFEGKIASLQKFLGQIPSPVKGEISIISPYYVSTKLSIPEIDVFFLLSLAEKEQLVHKKYKAFTIDGDTLLDDYENKNLIPNEIYNNATGDTVNKENFYIDIVYEIEK
jgi:hypothetical protein